MLENEQQLIGIIILRPTILAEIIDEFSDDLFESNLNKSMARACIKSFNNNGSYDTVSISDIVRNDETLFPSEKKGFITYLSELTGNVQGFHNFQYHLNKLKDRRDRKVLADQANNILSRVKDENEDIHDITSDVITELSGVTNNNSSVSLSTALDDFENQVKEFSESTREFLGEPTGFTRLDTMLSGIRKGHFGVLSAYTSTGKTFFALNIMWNFIKSGKSVAMFSLEMTPVDIVGRLISIATGIDSYDLRKGNLSHEERAKVEEVKEVIKKSKSFIYTNNNWTFIKMQMFKMSMSKQTDLIILDYLQLIKQQRITNLYESMLMVSHELQYLLQKFQIPMIALSQISNESNKSGNDDHKTPKGAGDISASADWVGLLSTSEKKNYIRDEKKKRKLPIKIKLQLQKNRHGETGKIDFYFLTSKGQFFEQDSFDIKPYENAIRDVEALTGDDELDDEWKKW